MDTLHRQHVRQYNDLLELADLRTKRFKVKQSVYRNRKYWNKLLDNPAMYGVTSLATSSEFVSAVTGFDEQTIKENLTDRFIQGDKLIGLLDDGELNKLRKHIERIEDVKRRG